MWHLPRRSWTTHEHCGRSRTFHDDYDGQPISVGEQRSADHHAQPGSWPIWGEWGWSDAPARRLVFSRDIPRRPRPLPRYLPPDIDRRLTAALESSPNRLFADALLLARATGLRIGELHDLELDGPRRLLRPRREGGLLETSGGTLFTTPHYDGYAAVLVRLTDVDLDLLTEVLEDSYRSKAPKRLLREFEDRAG